MSTPSRAVFLSYASEDAPFAQRIAEALRSAGIEVWFDQSELRDGDAWDQKIRREIQDCAPLIPVRAWSIRDPGIGNLLYDPFILRYKDDPRFAAFCREVGLPVPGEVRQQT